MRRRDFGALFTVGGLSAQTSGQENRKTAIAASIRALEAERDSAGGGDYNKWYARLGPFRRELRARMDSERANRPRIDPANPTVKQYLIRAEGKPPLFSEIFSKDYNAPDAEDGLRWAASLPSFAAVQSVARWLERKGIDLLFVPAPKMPDVYMDRILPGVMPKDGLAAPHLRAALLELLRKDVEVADLLPAMLRSKDSTPSPLFLPADNHWSPAGRNVCVGELASRLRRYTFVREAEAAPRLYLTQTVPLAEHHSFLALLSEKERVEVAGSLHPDTVKVTLLKDRPPFGQPYTNYPTAPVLVIGDSYSGQIGAQLAATLNLPVAMRPIPGSTVQPVRELLRYPDVLKDVKVVVWVVNYAVVCLFDWPELPSAIKNPV